MKRLATVELLYPTPCPGGQGTDSVTVEIYLDIEGRPWAREVDQIGARPYVETAVRLRGERLDGEAVALFVRCER